MTESRTNVDLGFLLLMSGLVVALFLTNSLLFDSALTIKWIGLFMLTGLGSGLLFFYDRLKLSPLLAVLLVVYLFSLVPGFFVAFESPQASYEVFRELGWAAFVLVLSTQIKEGSHWPLVLLTLAVTIISTWAGKEWLSQLTEVGMSHQSTYNVMAGFAHRNSLVEFLGLTISAPVALGVMTKGWRSTLAWIVAFGAASLMLLLLGRTGWMCLTLVTAVFLWNEGRSQWKRIRWFHLLIPLALLAMLFVSVDELYTIYHHFETALDVDSGTTRDRLLLAKRSWQLFTEHPWTGVGWGQWPIAIMPFDQFGMSTESAEHFYQRPHNDFLWLLSEGGIFPALAYIALLAAGLWQAFRKPKSPLRTWLIASFACYVMISLIAFPLERMEHRFILALLLAVSFSGKRQSVSMSAKWSWIPFGVSLMCLAWFVPRLSAERHLARAKEAMHAAKWRDMLAEVEQVNRHLTIDRTSTPTVWYKAVAQFNLNMKSEAFESFQQAELLNPFHPEVLNSLGVCAYEQGNTELAQAYFYKSVRYTTSFGRAWVNLAQLERTAGQSREAFETLAHADPKTADLNYDQLAMHLARERIDQLTNSYENRKLKLTLIAIRNTPHWAVDVYKKSVLNCIPFDDQVLIEAFYYMFSYCQEPSDCDEIREMKQRLIPDYPLLMDNGRLE